MKDKQEKKLLELIQNSFPINSRPFKKLAEQILASEEEILSKIKEWKANGLIRRIGAIFESKKLGFYSVLIAAKVPEEKISHFAKIVNSYPQVTHNYLRDDEFNIWFTFAASNEAEINNFVYELKSKTGIESIIVLPSKKVFKIRAVMPIGD